MPSFLRPDLPHKPSFTVSEIPHRAKLDQNESPFDLPAEVKQGILDRLARLGWNRYPQPRRYAEIKQRFAACIGQPPERVVLTAGCDQMILLAYWAAGGAGRRARFFEPTYPMFGYYAQITQTPVDRVVLGADFAVEALGDPVDLLLLVSPNNPTGRGPDRSKILEAVTRQPTCLVFVDEAYADYAGESIVDLVPAHPNLLVGRSLSKSMLAGVRLGYGVGHPEVVSLLEHLLFVPYHLSALQLAVAAALPEIQPHLAARVQAVVSERERLAQEIASLGPRVWPSRANFLLFAPTDAGRTYDGLLRHGVRIRNVSTMPGLGAHLRVTVGTAEENDLFLEALARSL
jgi:histidinol-phosphate aminotransferase